MKSILSCTVRFIGYFMIHNGIMERRICYMAEVLYASPQGRRSCCHREDCRYVRRIKENHRIKLSSVKKARKLGYRLCKYCFGMKADLLRRQKKIMQLCRERGLKCTFSGSVVFIDSPYSRWYFHFFEDSIELFHQSRWQNTKMWSGFHKQKSSGEFANYSQIIAYIAQHDRRRQPCDSRNWKEWRIHALLEELKYTD